MPKDYRLYLEEINEAIRKIEEYTKALSYEEFTMASMVTDAVIRNLEIIGEAVKKIPSEVRKEENTVDWKKIAGLRDILAHRYAYVRLEIIWDIVKKKIPSLKEAVKERLSKDGE